MMYKAKLTVGSETHGIYKFLNAIKLPSRIFNVKLDSVGRIAQSVKRLTTGWTIRDRIPEGTRFSAILQTGPEAHPASCTMGTWSTRR